MREEHFTRAGCIHRNSTRSSAYTSAMFSETRYALNGDLRVAYRTSREGPRDIVFVPNWFTCCEALPGAAVHSRVGRGDDIARSADLLRPAGHGSVRSRHAGRAADLGAMGRQHHRGARRSRESRSGPPRVRRRVRAGGAVRGNTSVPHNRAGRARGLRGSVGASPTRPRKSSLRWSPCGARGSCSMSSIRTCRGTRRSGQRGLEWNAWRRAQGPSLS